MEKLITALEECFPSINFTEEKKLYSDGILDSLAMVEIISILANQFDVVVTMDYMDPENFESVETIWNMIRELQQG